MKNQLWKEFSSVGSLVAGGGTATFPGALSRTGTVLHLMHKKGVVGDLELAVAVGLSVKQLKPPMDSGLGNTSGCGQGLLVLKSCDALVVKARAPFANGDVADAESLGNLQVGFSFSTGQNNLRRLHQAVRQCAGAGHGLQLLFLCLVKADGNGGGHRVTWAYSFNRLPSMFLNLSTG